MTIYIGADYRGKDLKKQIILYLKSNDFNVVDPFNDERSK